MLEVFLKLALMSSESLLLSLAIWFWSLLNSLFIYLDRMALSLCAAISDPAIALSLLGDLTKFSLGPTLAFVLSQWAFRRQRERARAQEKEDVLRLISLEISANFDRLRMLQRGHEMIMRNAERSLLKNQKTRLSPHGLQTRALDSQLSELSRALSPEGFIKISQIYQSFRTVAYAYENFREKEVNMAGFTAGSDENINWLTGVISEALSTEKLLDDLE